MRGIQETRFRVAKTYILTSLVTSCSTLSLLESESSYPNDSLQSHKLNKIHVFHSKKSKRISFSDSKMRFWISHIELFL